MGLRYKTKNSNFYKLEFQKKPVCRQAEATTPDCNRDSHITTVLPKRRDAGGLNFSVRAKFYLVFSKKIYKTKNPVSLETGFLKDLRAMPD